MDDGRVDTAKLDRAGSSNARRISSITVKESPTTTKGRDPPAPTPKPETPKATARGMAKSILEYIIAQRASKISTTKLTQDLEQLVKTIDQINKAAQQEAPISEKLENMSRDLAAMREKIDKMETRSYADVTRPTGNQPFYLRRAEVGHPHMEQQRKATEQRRDKAKHEVTLTMDNKKAITEATHEEITKCCQYAVSKAQLDGSVIKIQGVQKLKSNDIRIHCDTPEERKAQRNQLGKGL